MTLDCINQQFVFVHFLEDVNVAVGEDGVGLWLALDVLEDDMVAVDAEDKDTPVKPLSTF